MISSILTSVRRNSDFGRMVSFSTKNGFGVRKDATVLAQLPHTVCQMLAGPVDFYRAPSYPQGIGHDRGRHKN